MKSYLDLLQNVLDSGHSKKSRAVDPKTGNPVHTRSIFGAQWRHNLNNGFPLLTTKKVFFRGVAEELLWFLTGKTNVLPLREKNVHIWDAWAYDPDQKWGGRKARLSPSEEEGDVGPVYGHQWRSWQRKNQTSFPIDQISKVIETLKKDPDDRRMLVSAWNPDDIPTMGLPPCHYSFQFYTRGLDKHYELSCLVNMRSGDLFLGIPFNIASYALLTHMIAQITDMEVGELIFNFCDLHLYENHIDQVKEQLSRTPGPLPRLKLNQEINNIDDFKFSDFELVGYNPQPAIKAPVAV